jgi:hypothetical protein
VKPYIMRRGEPFAFGDRVESGTLLPGHSMRARMKPVAVGSRDVMPGDAVPAVDPPFTTSFVAAVGADPASFVHSLSAAQTVLITADEYLADSSLLLDGVVVWTSDPVRISVRAAASAVVTP